MVGGTYYRTQWGLSLPGWEHPLPSLHGEQEGSCGVCAGPRSIAWRQCAVSAASFRAEAQDLFREELLCRAVSSVHVPVQPWSTKSTQPTARP